MWSVVGDDAEPECFAAKSVKDQKLFGGFSQSGEVLSIPISDDMLVYNSKLGCAF
jgi:hypothetical protein